MTSSSAPAGRHFRTNDSYGVPFFKRSWFPTLAACLVVLVQLVVMFCFAWAKEGFFVDEPWSYGLANSLYFPQLFGGNGLNNAWLTPEFMKSYVTVDPGEQFRFDSVVYNLAHDAHPPLYFMVLHLVCSFFPGQFSKWFGIVPNMAFYAISALLMYRLVAKLAKSKLAALGAVTWWGFCPGIISLVIFIRMYMMASMLVLLLANVHYDILAARDVRPCKFVELVIASFLCFMCHYYLFILGFFIAAVTCIALLIQRRWKTFVVYGLLMVGSVLLAFAVFPAAIANLFGNGYSESGTSQQAFSQFGGHFVAFYRVVAYDLFTGRSWLQTIVAAAVVLGFIANLMQGRKDGRRAGSLVFAYAMGAAVILFFCAAVVVSPYQSSRYVSFIYSMVIALSCWALHGLLSAMFRSGERVRLAFGAVATAALVALYVFSYPNTVRYVYAGEANNIKAIEAEDSPQVLYLSGDPYRIIGKVSEVMETSGVWIASPTAESIDNAVNQIDPKASSFVVYLDEQGLAGTTKEDVLNRVISDSRFDGYRALPGYTTLRDGFGSDGVNIEAYEIYDSE